MIKVEKLSYSIAAKELYHSVSFEVEENQHAVLIGSNGTGKTMLLQLLLRPDEFLYEGKIKRNIEGRVGYVSQFENDEKVQDMTVFDFLAADFAALQAEMEAVCAQMETAENLDALMERYQQILDESLAIDADRFDSNIHKALKTAGLAELAELPIAVISGGEYKLVQVIRQMLRKPALLIMDEPDAFLDFGNLKGLRELINGYEGTLLAVTHNRYLLNHCFDKVLHLEGGDIQAFEGSFIEYHYALLSKKIELQEKAAQQQEEIDRSRKVVDRLRADAAEFANAALGRAVNAKAAYLERLKKQRIKDPFVALRQPQIALPHLPACEAGEEQPEAEEILNVSGYSLAFEDTLFENIQFVLKQNEKAAIVGANGTGKTTLLRDIFQRQKESIHVAEGTEIAFLSQLGGEMLDESRTVYEEMEAIGTGSEPGMPFANRIEIEAYLAKYCFDEEMLAVKIGLLSAGEKNLLQLAKIGRSHASLLLLDEPTSHLDTRAQAALEAAIKAYPGAVLMVSHDVHTIVNCADYVLLAEDKGIRKMRIRSFRKMIYADHFKMEYLELEQKKKELEQRIENCLSKHDFESAKGICDQLADVIGQMKEKAL